jgi:FOG: HPt domain
MSTSDATPPVLDRAVLESLFAMGDDALRVALGDQLVADFRRLRTALRSDVAYEVGRAVHELKGLSATIGATRLADMARSIDAVAQGLPPAALAAVIAPLQAELDAVLDNLTDVVGDTSRQ